MPYIIKTLGENEYMSGAFNEPFSGELRFQFTRYPQNAHLYRTKKAAQELSLKMINRGFSVVVRKVD